MLTSSDIEKRLINNDALFNNIYVVHQNFDILPCDTKHFGTSIDYQDLLELRDDFLNELYDTIVDWVFSSPRYVKLKEAALRKGKSESAASSEIQRKDHSEENICGVLRTGSSLHSAVVYSRLWVVPCVADPATGE